jgi:hypothetical protein
LDTYHVVLYVHFLSLLLGFGAATIIVVCLFKLRAAVLLRARPSGSSRLPSWGCSAAAHT